MNRNAVFAVRLAISGGCLWLAFRLMPGDVLTTLAQAQAGWLLAAAGISVLAILVMALRLWVLAPSHDMRFFTTVAVTWSGQFGAMLGLGLLSADGARVARLAQAGHSVRLSARLVLTDRVFGLSGLVILAAGGWVAFLSGGATGMAAGLVLLGLATLVLSGLQRIRRLKGVTPPVALSSLRIGLALALSVLLHGLSITIFFFATKALNSVPPMPEMIVAVSIGLLFSILPVSMGGWGVRELAIAQGFALVGGAFPNAVPASVLFGLVVLLVALPGVLWLLWVPEIPAED